MKQVALQLFHGRTDPTEDMERWGTQGPVFLVNYVQGYIIAHSMGLDMSFFDATCLLAIASLLGLLPISVSGVGVRELFFSLVFPLLGFAPAQGVTFGLLVFFVIYLVNIGIGFISFQLAPPPGEKVTLKT